MKVTLSKFGGFAAGMRRPPKVVDATELPPAEVEELQQLVRTAIADPAASKEVAASPGEARDAMSYRIEIEDGGRTNVLSASDAVLPASFLALRDWLERHASTAPTR